MAHEPPCGCRLPRADVLPLRRLLLECGFQALKDATEDRSLAHIRRRLAAMSGAADSSFGSGSSGNGGAATAPAVQQLGGTGQALVGSSLLAARASGAAPFLRPPEGDPFAWIHTVPLPPATSSFSARKQPVPAPTTPPSPASASSSLHGAAGGQLRFGRSPAGPLLSEAAPCPNPDSPPSARGPLATGAYQLGLLTAQAQQAGGAPAAAGRNKGAAAASRAPEPDPFQLEPPLGIQGKMQVSCADLKKSCPARSIIHFAVILSGRVV